MEKDEIITTNLEDGTYIIDFKDFTYYLTIKANKQSIEIKIKRQLSFNIFEGIFQLEDFGKFNRTFLLFEDIHEIHNFIIDKIDKNEFSIKENEEKFSLFLYTKVIDDKIKKIEILIPKNPEKKDIESITDDLSKHILELSNKLKKMEMENKKLKEENVHNVKAHDITRSRIMSFSDEELIKKWISETNPENVKLSLIYRATLHGDTASAFHSKCDNKGPTLTIVETTTGRKFGGFSNLNWDQSANYKTNDAGAFLFSLDTKIKFKNTNSSNIIYGNSSYGPTFGGGHDFYIADKCTTNVQNYCNFPYSYGAQEVFEFPKSANLSGAYNFLVKELEVYTVAK